MSERLCLRCLALEGWYARSKKERPEEPVSTPPWLTKALSKAGVSHDPEICASAMASAPQEVRPSPMGLGKSSTKGPSALKVSHPKTCAVWMNPTDPCSCGIEGRAG